MKSILFFFFLAARCLAVSPTNEAVMTGTNTQTILVRIEQVGSQ
jgi:hypothetical protein